MLANGSESTSHKNSCDEKNECGKRTPFLWSTSCVISQTTIRQPIHLVSPTCLKTRRLNAGTRAQIMQKIWRSNLSTGLQGHSHPRAFPSDRERARAPNILRHKKVVDEDWLFPLISQKLYQLQRLHPLEIHQPTFTVLPHEIYSYSTRLFSHDYTFTVTPA